MSSDLSSNPRGGRPRWIDFHCHVDLYPDHAELIEECDQHEVLTLAVTTTPRAWPRNCEVAKNSRFVRVALGLHPQLIDEGDSEILEFERFLPSARYVGEVGLDAGPKYSKFIRQQRAAFQRVLESCASLGGKILTVHSVRAVEHVLAMVELYLPPSRGKVVLHWFTGTQAQADRAVELGCYFSINQQMLINPRRRKVVRSLPIERLLTETDGPFVQLANRPARPKDIQKTVAVLAHACDTTWNSMAAQLLQNVKALVA